ncbi:MAG: rod shape-determining protein MreC [Streptococcaceae bacterium]|nr:rod shape-determining protein MreC [Streptococcaceae bacterium]
MKKFNLNKNIIVILMIIILVIATVTLSVLFMNKRKQSNIVTSTINDSIAFVDKTLSAPIKFLHNGISMIDDLVNTYEENKQLKVKLDDYDEAVVKSKNKDREIKDLKEQLKLNETLTDFEKITSNVIDRSTNSWQNNLIVDKGVADGIEKDMAVMSKDGLIGRVVQVNKHSSKVELLTTTNNSVNRFYVRISGSDGAKGNGVIKCFDEKTQTLLINRIQNQSEIKKGDLVQTSGLGGSKAPADLLIGKVVKVKSSEDGASKEVYVKPRATMYDISVVTIIKRSSREVAQP